ncbi:hypothetical protein, partial [Actinacidiphila soli]|uniref:hypothetical protein n=1 Tax=Actinacidiphila soli TaxID=2487275 RepID=UPI0019CF6706
MTMTDNKSFKKAVRQRMAETGEPFSTARRALLARTRRSAIDSPNTVPDQQLAARATKQQVDLAGAPARGMQPYLAELA